MKKGVIITAIILIVLVLFLPIPRGTYKDGGTKDYSALTYRIVVWNRFVDEINAKGSVSQTKIYHKASVFCFPDNLKSIDELWEIEMKKQETTALS